jgi:hypothetical protein
MNELLKNQRINNKIIWYERFKNDKNPVLN